MKQINGTLATAARVINFENPKLNLCHAATVQPISLSFYESIAASDVAI